MPFARPGTTALLAVGLLAAGVTGCSSSAGGRSADGTHAGAAKRDRVAAVSVTAAYGCRTDRVEFPAGALTFAITNRDATAVSEVVLLSGARIVREQENIPPGFSGEFTVHVSAGKYTLYCPGADPERTTLTVTGTSSSPADSDVSALLDTATTGYVRYVDSQVAALVAAVGRFDAALHGTDLAAARTAYMRARPFYERIEPVAESFVIGKDSIDTDIDARAGGVPAARWRGFHRIEKALFQQRTLAGMGAFGDALVADVERLRQLTSSLNYDPTELANGAQELLDEVSSSKITGEEETYSHIDLLDFAGNAAGAEQAFAQLQPAVAKIDPALSASIQARFTSLGTLLDTYRDGSNPSGFRLYGTLTAADKRALAAAVKAVQEPLSKVASKVTGR